MYDRQACNFMGTLVTVNAYTPAKPTHGNVNTFGFQLAKSGCDSLRCEVYCFIS